MKNFIIKNKKEVTYVLFALGIFILSLFFPYTSDDWAWGSNIGIDRLGSLFANYNGRYIGNILVIVMTRSILLRSLIISFVLTGIVNLIEKIINKNNYTVILMTVLLILLIPKAIFSQTIVWASGFTNYVVSIFISLIYICFNKNIQQENKTSGWIISVLFMLIGIIGSLIMEFITIYNILLGLFMIIYTYYKYKKLNKTQLLFLLGSLIGAIIMFSNGAYHNVVSGTDFYRSLPLDSSFGLINRIAGNYFLVIHKFLLFNNILLNIIISLLFIILSYRYTRRTNKLNNIVKFLILIPIIYVTYTIFKYISPTWMILSSYTVYFEGFFTFIYGLDILILTFILINDKAVKERLLFYLISIIIMCGPLLVVHPVTSRCFFPMYIVLVLYIIELFMFTNNKFKISLPFFNKSLIIFIILSFIYLFNLFLYISIFNNRRNNYILDQANRGEKVIEIDRMPHKGYLKTPDPDDNSTWEERFKMFYKIDKSVDLIIKE